MSSFGFSQNYTLVEEAGFATATTTLSSITSGTGAEGSWTELIASTAADSDFISVYLSYQTQGSGAAVEEMLVDVAIGAAASEQTIIENMLLSTRVFSVQGTDVVSFPIRIPAGTRVSARVGADSALNTGIGIKLFESGEKGSFYSGAKGFGISANASGIAVDPGGAANTKGSWTELVASSSDAIYGFWIHVGLNENLTVSVPSGTFTDIGIGGAGSEQVIVPDHYTYATTGEESMKSVFYNIYIPSGTRIAARSQCTDTDATDRIRTIAIVGII